VLTMYTLHCLVCLPGSFANKFAGAIRESVAQGVASSQNASWVRVNMNSLQSFTVLSSLALSKVSRCIMRAKRGDPVLESRFCEQNLNNGW
jgi:hypothetical protein